MGDILAFLDKHGVPAGLILICMVGLYLADKLHLWQRPARKSDREMLSLDELSFRRDLLKRIGLLETSLTHCEDKHAIAIAWMVGIISDLRKAGFTAFAPLPKDLAELALRVGVAVEGAQ